MTVNDLLQQEQEQRNQFKIHQRTFTLWPRQWEEYNLPDSFKWEIHPFKQNQAERIPNKPGIYSFLIQPGIASHPSCSYLVYIGKADKCNLRKRFRDYFSELKNPKGRPKILDLLQSYQGYLHFCCSAIAERERIGEIEDALLSAFIPPCNDRLPAAINRIVRAFQ